MILEEAQDTAAHQVCSLTVLVREVQNVWQHCQLMDHAGQLQVTSLWELRGFLQKVSYRSRALNR
jgi:hypothetical protein